MPSRLAILREIITAWKRKDLDSVLGHMHEDIVWHFAAPAQPPAIGKAAARRFLERFGAGIREVRWRIFCSAEQGSRLFVEGVDEYVASDGTVVSAPYAGVLEFSGDLVIGWRDYVDMGMITENKAGAPLPEHVKALLSRTAAF